MKTFFNIKTVFNKNFKEFLAVLAFTTLCAGVNSANAAHSVTTIAVIDAEKVLKESLAMTDIQNKVVKKQEEYQKEVNKKQNSLEEEKRKIESKKNTLSKEKFAKEEQVFNKKVEDFKNYVEKRQNTLQKSSLEAVSKVNEVLKKVVSDIAKEKSFQVVLNNSQAIFYEESIDISVDVISKLNKAIEKVEVKFE
jgi:outer membrane protein